MRTCPACERDLEDSPEAEHCPHCGAVLRGGTVADLPALGVDKTIEFDRLQQTLSDSLPEEDLPGLKDSSHHATLDLGPGKTLSSVPDVPPPTGTRTLAESTGTVEFSPLERASSELAQDHLASGNTTGSADGNRDEADDDREVIRMVPGHPHDSVDQPLGRTVDSVDLPASGQDSGKTIADRRLDVTIDSVEGLDLQSRSGTDRTLDSGELPPVAEPKPGTVAGNEIAQTIASVDDAAPVWGRATVDERHLNVTYDGGTVDEGSRPRTVPDREVMATYDSHDISSRDARQVDQMWRGANVEKASPRMTIKGREAGPPPGATSLVIQARRFCEPTAEPNLSASADYQLLKTLGQGGMGVVYAARQASIDRGVAVKMLKPEMARESSQRNKFLAEAVITGELDHPNIVPIYDLGKNHEGSLFYAMKKVQGTPWDRVIARKSLVENLEILMKVSDAVAFAHSRFVVHRDLKPENIMLGDFGEVLVMDWGLALPFGKFAKTRTIQPTASMGGTPAYMSPEMATGPFDRINPTSDVYLLGAILFEIVAGKPPHTGKDVMKCLFAAARNEIQPSPVTGELMDIALKAMSTKQADRYQTVQEFQLAVRDYESHAASIEMAERAAQTQAAAETADSYDQFATAVFEFQESLKLWSGNSRAIQGVPAARLAYATSALRKGDLDLADSLLDPTDASHAECRLQITAARRDRESRQMRLQKARRAVRFLAVAVFLAVTTGLVAVTYQSIQVRRSRDQAVASAEAEKVQRDKAETNAREALRQEGIAKDNAQRAEQAASEARRQEQIAKEQEQIAKTQEALAKENARREQAAAIEAKRQEGIAKTQQQIAEYEAYVALIGLAAAKIDENAFAYARELLEQCPRELRNWEWGRLMHLCQQSVREYSTGAPAEAVAYSADGRRFVSGGWEGRVQVWNAADGAVVCSITPGRGQVHAVAFSPDGRWVATGSSEAARPLCLWNAETGELVKALAGHTDGVLSVAFSRDGRRLLSASYDNTARLWNLETGENLRTYRGHNWWVWDARFSADEQQIVTSSQDGTVLVWKTDTGEHLPPFMGHQGPVYAVAFSPDGTRVFSAGYDRRILVWRPTDISPFNFSGLVAGDAVVPPKFQELTGHQAAIRSLAFSSAGNVLISGGHDNVVKVWNLTTGETIKTLRGHNQWVRGCDISPDGNWVLSASHDETVRLWNIAGYAESRVLATRSLQGHDDAVLGVALSADGQRIFTASRDRTARSWNARTSDPEMVFREGHAFLASSAVFHPDGRSLFTAAVDGTTRGWDVEQGVQKVVLEGTGLAAALAISHDGRWLLTGANRRPDGVGVAQLWNAATGERLREFPGHDAEVTAVAFAPHDRVCYTGDANGRGMLWNVETGQAIRRLDWHTSKVAAARFLPDGRRLLTGSDDQTVAQWDTAQLETQPESVRVDPQWTLKHGESVLGLDVTADGTKAITCTVNGEVTIWDLQTSRAERTLPVTGSLVNAVAFSADGRRALTVQPDPEQRLVRIWEVASGREMLVPSAGGQPGPFLDLKRSGGLVWSALFAPRGEAVLTIGGNEARLWDARQDGPGGRELMAFSPHAAVAALAVSPDGQRLVTGSWDNSARVWDVATGSAVLKLADRHQGAIQGVAYSPNGQLIVTASDDRTACLWDATTGAHLRSFTGHGGAVRFAGFSPSGEQVITASDDKLARLWNAATGELLREFRGHQWGVRSAAFSADGRRVVTGSDDNTATIWNVDGTGDPIKLQGHTAPVTSVAFAPDGRRVLTASEDFAAKLWDASNGKEILHLPGHSQGLTSIAFSRDGRYALTGSRDGTAILWLTAEWTTPPASGTSP